MALIYETELGAVGRYINLGDDATDTSTLQTVLVYARLVSPQPQSFGYPFGRVDPGSSTGHRYAISDKATLGVSTTAHAQRPSYDSAIINYGDLWTHFATSWNGSTDGTGFAHYASTDGSPIALIATGAGQSTSGTPTSAVGKNLYLLNREGLDRSLTGDVAYIARWNRVLSLAELQTAQADGPLSVPDGLILCWANEQDYGPKGYVPVARTAFVAGALPPNLNLGGDTTAPILTSPAGTKTGTTTASGSVVTDEANGTLYRLASQNASESGATVKTGATQAVTATGSQPVTFTSLAPATTYYAHYLHRDAAGNDSTVASSASFTTDAAADTTPPTHTGVVTISALTHTSYTASWPAATDANGVTGYEYRIAAGAWVDVGAVLTTDITGRTPSATELFEVRAYDAAGNRSTPPLSESVTLQDQPAPTGTVTISGVVPADTTAQVTYNYSAADQSGFEYRIDGGAAASIGASPATISGLTVDTSYDIEIRAINAGGAGAWSAITNFTTNAVITVITDIDSGNIDPAQVVITNGGSATPTVFVNRHSLTGSWRHMLFAVENAEGKRPIFELNRSTRQTSATPGAGWGILWTQDFVTWVKSPYPSLVSGTPNKIVAQFTDPLPAGRVYISTQPMLPESDAAVTAAALLANYPGIASAPPSANAQGVYNVSPAETGYNGRNIGGRNMHAIKLSWPGPTTDGFRKRILVMTSGIHAAGESNSVLAHRSALSWMLDSQTAEAIAFRANWNVYTYFNLTPNGYYGGHARTNFRNTSDPNRVWHTTTLAEINATRTAITTDLSLGSSGKWDVMLPWHSYYEDPNDFQFWLTSAQFNTQTRTPLMQTFIDTGASFFNDPAVFEEAAPLSTELWWAETQGVQISISAENQQNGNMDPQFFKDVGTAWMRTLQAVDAAGYFSAPSTLTITASDLAQTSARISVQLGF